MISFDDPRWDDLEGGYRAEYDPRPALQILDTSPDDADVWAELWEELHTTRVTWARRPTRRFHT